jgi:phosphoesterase RecJ-like protein
MSSLPPFGESPGTNITPPDGIQVASSPSPGEAAPSHPANGSKEAPHPESLGDALGAALGTALAGALRGAGAPAREPELPDHYDTSDSLKDRGSREDPLNLGVNNNTYEALGQRKLGKTLTESGISSSFSPSSSSSSSSSFSPSFKEFLKDKDIFGERPQFIEAILRSERILVLEHFNPDGDALGAATALGHALRNMGKETTVGTTGKIPPNLFFLMEPEELFREVFLDKYFLAEFDLAIFVDCHGPERTWPDGTFEDFSYLPPYLVIDHHVHGAPLTDPIALIHHPAASSTGELVAKLIKDMGLTFTKPIVEALLTAIVSDTNFFTQSNATPSSLRETADLVALGGDLENLNVKLNQSWTLSRMRLLEKALGTLETHFDGKLALITLTSDMLKEVGATLEDADGFVEYPRGLSGVDLAAFIKEDGHGRVKVSLRSRYPVSAREIAQCFGGGGHMRAAAYTDSSKEASQAKARFLAKVRECWPF